MLTEFPAISWAEPAECREMRVPASVYILPRRNAANALEWTSETRPRCAWMCATRRVARRRRRERGPLAPGLEVRLCVYSSHSTY